MDKKNVRWQQWNYFFNIFLQIFCLFQLFLTLFLLYRNIKNNKHKLLTFYRDTKEVIVVQYRLAKKRRTKKYKNRKQEYYNRLSSYNCKEGISYFSIPHFFATTNLQTMEKICPLSINAIHTVNSTFIVNHFPLAQWPLTLYLCKDWLLLQLFWRFFNT